LPFKCNLQRYITEDKVKIIVQGLENMSTGGARYTLNQVDPQLESAWFQTLNLTCDFLGSLVSGFPGYLISWLQNLGFVNLKP
jgi:hypothetical protein